MPFHLIQRLTVSDSMTVNPKIAMNKFNESERQIINTHNNAVKELANTQNIHIDKYVSNNVLVTSYSAFSTANDAVWFYQSMSDLPSAIEYRDLMRNKTSNTTVQKYSVSVRLLDETHVKNVEFISENSNTIVQTISHASY